MIPAVVICSLMLIGIIAGLAVVSCADRPAAGKHTRHALAVPAAAPPDVTGPAAPRHARPVTWDETAPEPQRHGGFDTSTAALARVRDALLASSAWAETTGTPVPDADLPQDATRAQMHAVCTWGKTAAEMADELAAEHLAVSDA